MPDTTRWPISEQTEGKLMVLQAYLEQWIPKLGSWNGRILFVDGFCGPGEYAGGEDGSPILALRTFLNHPIRDQVNEIGFRFCDEDEARLRHLETRIASLGPLPDNCTIGVWHGNFATEMNSVLDVVQRGKGLAPSLVMMDPFGVKGIPMSLISRILSENRCEVLVSFMWEVINRRMKTPEFEPHMTAAFGTEEWKAAKEMPDGETRRVFLFPLYERQLRAAGAAHVIRYDLFRGNRHVYSVFFGTQSWKGADAMKRAIWKAAPDRTFQVRAYNQYQQLMVGGFDPRELEQMLREKFGVNWAHVEREIFPFVGGDTTPFHTSQIIRATLEPAKKGGRLEVDPPGRGMKKKSVRFK